MAQTTEGATESVDAVRFSFMSDDEVRKHSFVKITNPNLLDIVERPVPGGLYDPLLGPLDEGTLCQSCGQRPIHCPGHCGHIDLVYLVYNPLLFNFLHNLIQRTCFFCCHFRADRSRVETCMSQLKLIAKGDIAGAKRLDSANEFSYAEDSDGFHGSCSAVRSGSQFHDNEHIKQQEWTSLQFIEAKTVLNDFLKLKSTKCQNCNAKNPKISKPTFGWLHMSGMSSAHTRQNVIRGCKLGEHFAGGAEGTPSSEVEDAVDAITWENGIDTADTLSTGAASSGPEGASRKERGRKLRPAPVEFHKQKNFFSGPLLPSEVKEILELLWENEFGICSFISDIQQQGFGTRAGHSMFFLETILVPPIKFRPPARGGDSVMEHPQTVLLNKVLQSNISLGNAHINDLDRSKVINRWMDLQQSVNVLFDGKTAVGQGQRDVASGICQLLEKKEGMFRQKMMGKRVNYACRSVISPDPYLAVNEIGIPPYFALRLTYPERVTPWNVVKLREAIIKGPESHPGATHYVDKLSITRLPPSRKGRISISRKLPSSRGAVMEPGKFGSYEFEGKIVYRHLQDGDIVLVNRQPTLHKPSIMAHVVRVLKGEKTLRMHYANCSTYNADFDGDEMNVHFPQDEISRAEAYNIVNANNQYVRPASGEPVRALIQDHIVSAVLLTNSDAFLSLSQVNQLLYSSGLSMMKSNLTSGRPGRKVSTLTFEEDMQPPNPAVYRPEPLWTGKQVITAVLNHITRGHPPITVEKEAKIPSDFFRREHNVNELSEKKKDDGRKLKEEKSSTKRHADKDKPQIFKLDSIKLLISKNEVLCGVIDKAQFADYGLVHTMQELYGSNAAGILLSTLSRLLTVYLQMHGFTCGVDDLLIKKDEDEKRKEQLKKCEVSGQGIYREVFRLAEDIGPKRLQLKIEEAIHREGESAVTALDRKMTSKLNEKTSEGVIKNLLSLGLAKPTGKNCISLMTSSGAKGSKVNFQQISSHLGQQELEGKRVPRMVSGKTLPCFHPWNWAPRAGGFITDRFLTGLRPQEYFFHCMAGREGLVDTAVKTSRSGYLQRCLIKNLESLKISYDHTVRDADGSIVQFQYGEDGVDVHQTSFITKFEALAANQDMVYKKSGQEMPSRRCQLDASNSYITDIPCALKEKAAKFVDEFGFQERINFNLLKQEDFLKLMRHKYLLSLAQPGEPVGVLAAQSVGEPSTQLTLNTFHFAGRGEMNVTLGIPRLQEILMTASNDIKTPIMTCPLQMGKTMDDANRLADKLKKITVADIVGRMEVSVTPFAVHNDQICSIYKLKMKLHKPAYYPKYTDISEQDWQDTLEVAFVRELEDAIQNHILLLSKISGIKNFVTDSQPKASNETSEDDSGRKSQREEEKDDDADEDEDGEAAEDLGLDVQKRKQQATDEMDYEEVSDEELNDGVSSAGFESEVDQAEDETEIRHDDLTGNNDETSELPRDTDLPKQKSTDKKTETAAKRKKKVRAKLVKKETDRAIFVSAKESQFDMHFKLVNEPHILLAQIAQKSARKVYIQSSGKIENCRVTTCKENQIIYHGENPKLRKDVKPEEKEKIPALHTTGIDFNAFWQMQDYLDVRYIYSNSIHAMLNTYGVEAARETIIREIKHVFGSYGIAVNIRHLTLIADFMTQSGGYRPMNRLGGIAESTSPFSKMSFETASKFIVEAAAQGATDNLETPSARICLGLPVKMGTGTCELLQKVEI